MRNRPRAIMLPWKSDGKKPPLFLHYMPGPVGNRFCPFYCIAVKLRDPATIHAAVAQLARESAL